MAHEHRVTRRIPFADTDVAGIVHFANFFRYMEDTEHDFYRSLELSVHTPTDTGWIGWPRVHAECRYVRPLRFEEEVDVHLIVRQCRRSTISYGFMFRRPGDEPAAPLAMGAVTVACAARDVTRDAIQSMAMPAPFAERIGPAPEELRSAFDQMLEDAGRKQT